MRAIAEELDSPVTILQDLQGPKVRVGQLPGGEIALLADTLELTAMAKRIARHVQQQAKADPFERERLRITANQALLELLRLARETRRHGPTFGLTFCTAHAEAAASKLGRLAR